MARQRASEWISPAEAAEILGVNASTVRRQIHAGEWDDHFRQPTRRKFQLRRAAVVERLAPKTATELGSEGAA